MPEQRISQIGIVIFPGALPLDFIGPATIFTALSPAAIAKKSVDTPLAFEITYIAESTEEVACTGNLNIKPSKTFADVKDGRQKIDLMLLPGGQGARTWVASQGLKEFIKWGAENIEHVLTVCTGSWLLASTGALDGQKATTNKQAFKECQEATSDQSVEWKAEARFVHSGKFWTASGVSAGIDMACGFVDATCGKAAGKHVREWAEYTSADEGEDPFAKQCGLV